MAYAVAALHARRRTSPPQLEHALSCSVVGSPGTVRRGLEAFVARTAPDELMVTAQVFDHAARLRSFEIVAEVAGLPP